jgi:hypothetical protein
MRGLVDPVGALVGAVAPAVISRAVVEGTPARRTSAVSEPSPAVPLDLLQYGRSAEAGRECRGAQPGSVPPKGPCPLRRTDEVRLDTTFSEQPVEQCHGRLVIGRVPRLAYASAQSAQPFELSGIDGGCRFVESVPVEETRNGLRVPQQFRVGLQLIP